MQSMYASARRLPAHKKAPPLKGNGKKKARDFTGLIQKTACGVGSDLSAATLMWQQTAARLHTHCIRAASPNVLNSTAGRRTELNCNSLRVIE
jgi:hypothetical protein